MGVMDTYRLEDWDRVDDIRHDVGEYHHEEKRDKRVVVNGLRKLQSVRSEKETETRGNTQYEPSPSYPPLSSFLYLRPVRHSSTSSAHESDGIGSDSTFFQFKVSWVHTHTCHPDSPHGRSVPPGRGTISPCLDSFLPLFFPARGRSSPKVDSGTDVSLASGETLFFSKIQSVFPGKKSKTRGDKEEKEYFKKK